MVQAAESYLSEMQKVAGEDGLADAEIARLLKTVQAAQFKRSEVIPADADGSFKPRSLVEIAFEAEKKRQEDAARQLAMEKAAQLAAQQAEQQAEQAGEDASENLPDNGAANQTVAQPEADSENPDMGSAADNPTAVQDAGAISQPALSQQQEAEQEAAVAQARQQREAEDASLRAQAEEDGYKRGFDAGLEAARSAEPTEEEKAHMAAKEQERLDIINRLEAVIAATASADAVDVSELAPVLEQAVLRLASERAGLAISENPQGLVQRIENLVEKVKSGAQSISVTLNPDDLKAVDRWRPAVSTHSAWVWRSDASLASGDIRLKLDGITVTDLLGADTNIQLAENAEAAMATSLPSPEMPEEKPEDMPAEIQAGEMPEEAQPDDRSEDMLPEQPLPEQPLMEAPLAEAPAIAQSSEMIGEAEAEIETETEAESGKTTSDEDVPEL